MTPLFLHVPHDATLIPPAACQDFLVTGAELAREMLRLTDAHTAELYAADCPPEQVVRAEVSRLVVDVERFADDDREPCAAFGMGATYVKTTDGQPLRYLSPARRSELLKQFYWPHHARLETAARERLQRFGHCLLLDAHSFPSSALPTQVTFELPPEIGIGTEGIHTTPELTQRVTDFFQRQGLTVAVNRPFAGAMVPSAYYGQDARVQSVMIEVRRDLYMDEITGEKHAGFGRIQAVLKELRESLE